MTVKSPPPGGISASYKLVGLGGTFAAAIIGFTLGGWALDGWLGLTPLFRFDSFDSSGRGALAGLEMGDTVLEWDDISFPSSEDSRQATHHNSETDTHFTGRKADARRVEG